MRIRTIKPGFFTDERLAALHPLTRIMFVGLWCIADRAGRLEDRPLRIKATVLPYDEHDVDAALTELQSAGFVVRYVVGAQKLIEIPGLTRHQHFNAKEVPSLLPPRPGTVRARCRNGAGTIPTRQEGKGTGKEQEGKGTDTEPGALANPEAFDAFWTAYPLKVGKQTARKAWGKLAPDAALVGTILAAVGRHAASARWREEGGRFIPHPATWLNGARWEDELQPPGATVRRFESKRTEGNLDVLREFAEAGQ